MTRLHRLHGASLAVSPNPSRLLTYVNPGPTSLSVCLSKAKQTEIDLGSRALILALALGGGDGNTTALRFASLSSFVRSVVHFFNHHRHPRS